MVFREAVSFKFSNTLSLEKMNHLRKTSTVKHTINTCGKSFNSASKSSYNVDINEDSINKRNHYFNKKLKRAFNT